MPEIELKERLKKAIDELDVQKLSQMSPPQKPSNARWGLQQEFIEAGHQLPYIKPFDIGNYTTTGIIPPDRLKNLDDDFESLNNELFKSRGLDIPTQQTDLNDMHKWVREYMLKTEEADPVFKSLMTAAANTSDPTYRSYESAFAQSAKILYHLTTAEPSARELDDAFKDAVKTWYASEHLKYENLTLAQQAKIYDEPFPLIFSELADIPPEQIKSWRAPIKLPNDFPFEEYQSFYTQYKNSSSEQFQNSLLPTDKDFLEALEANNFFKFFDRHKNFFISRKRLENMLLSPVSRETPFKIYRFPNREYINDNIPSEKDFHYSILWPISRPVWELAQKVEEFRNAPPTKEQLGAEFTEIAIKAARGESSFPPTPKEIQNTTNLILGYTGKVLHYATLGIPEAVIDEVRTSLGPTIAEKITGDPRTYEAYIDSWASVLARKISYGIDPKGTERFEVYDNLWRNYLPIDDPVLDAIQSHRRLNTADHVDLALKRLTDAERFPTASKMFKVLGMENPHLRNTVSNIIGSFTEDGTGLILAALGTRALWSATRKVAGPLKTLTPGKKSRVAYRSWKNMTALERHFVEGGQFDNLPATLRTIFVEELDSAIGKIKDTKSAGELLNRLNSVLSSGPLAGPLDPKLTAGAIQAAKDLTAALSKTAGSKLTKEARRALARVPPAINKLGFGDSIFISGLHDLPPAMSSEFATSLIKHYNALRDLSQIKHPLTEVHLRGHLNPTQFLDLTRNLTKVKDLIETTAQRKRLLYELFDDIEPQVMEELRLNRAYLESYITSRQDLVKYFNKGIAQTLDNYSTLELKGGKIPIANPQLRTQLFDYLRQLKAGTKKIKDFPQDPLFETFLKEVPEAKLLKEDILAKGIPSQVKNRALQRLNSYIDRWLETNSRPEYKDFPANPNPNRPFIESLLDKLKTVKAGQPVELSKAEIAELFKHVPENIRPNPNKSLPAYAALQAMDKDIKSLSTNIKQNENLLTGIKKAHEDLKKVEPLRASKIQINAALKKALADELSSPAWELRNKRYLSISPGLTRAELTAYEAFNEAVNGLSKDAILLKEGIQKYSDLDYAIASYLWPNHAASMLRREGDIAANMEYSARVIEQQILQKLGRKLTPEESQRLFRDGLAGKVFDKDPELQQILRAPIDNLLIDAWRSGRIGPGYLQKLLENKQYYRRIYEREDLVNAYEIPFKRPPKYNLLRLDESELKQAIPEAPWYIAVRDTRIKKKADQIKYIKTFDDHTAAEAYINSPEFKNAWPAGAEVAIRPGMTVGEKELIGLVGEAFAPHADLVLRLARNNATNFMARAIASSRNFSRPYEWGGGKNMIETGKERWYLVTDPKVPHLYKKYVKEDVLEWLSYTRTGYDWYNQILKEINGKPSTLQNPLLTTSEKLTERFLGRPGPPTTPLQKSLNVLGNTGGLTWVALNLKQLSQQLLSNVFFNLPAQGIYLWRPEHFIKFLYYGTQGAFSHLKQALPIGKAIKYDDPYWKMLIDSGLHESREIAVLREQAGLLQKNWHSIEALASRYKNKIEDLRVLKDERGVSINDPRYLKMLVEKDRLEIELNSANINAMKTLTGHSIDIFTKKIFPGLVDIFTGKSKINEKLFGAVSFWDNISKYVALRVHLDRGMSPENALEHIRAFSQNLHLVPEPVKALNRTFGGNVFTSYPFNQLRVFGNILKYKPQFLSKYLMAIAAWNYANMSVQYNHPEEQLEMYGRSQWGGRNLWTDFMFLTGRYYLPNGGQISADPAWGWLMPKSQFYRDLDRDIRKGQAPLSMKVAASVSMGLTSRFFLGHIPFNLATMFSKQRDYRGNPLHSFSDYTRAIGEMIAPHWTPGLGSDWKEVHDYNTTNYIDHRTGESKNIWETLARGAFSYIPPTLYTTTPQKAKIILDSQFQGDETRPTIFSPLRLDENRFKYVWDRANLTKNRTRIKDDQLYQKIVQEWAEDEGHQRRIFNRGVLVTPERIKDYLNRVKYPQIFDDFRGSNLEGNIGAWHLLNIYDRNPTDHRVLQNFKEIIDTKIDRAQYSINDITQNLIPAINSWLMDVEISSAHRGQLDKWKNRLNQMRLEKIINQETKLPSLKDFEPARPKLK